MTTLHLKHEWTLGDRIGDVAGFGKVFAAASPEHPRAVAKLVPKAPGAQREMLLADDLGGVRNVVPVIDSGETTDDWALIMPRAERSLLAHLNEASGALGVVESVAILSDLATALADLDGRVVHRDLKPANVLLLDGTWCLADFGISRYAEATTAPDTRKLAWTPAYASPEQWRAERATSATDVYALGVIAYELLTGTRPFRGPSAHDYREQHLHAEPPALREVPTALAALIEECLLKSPKARPTPSNVLARLARANQAAQNSGLAALEEANRAEVARRRERDLAASSSRSQGEERADLASSAGKMLIRIGDALKDAVLQSAPSVEMDASSSRGWTLKLNGAKLHFSSPSLTSADPWGGWQPPAFKVVSHAAISVTFTADRYGYEGRSHSLWFCDAQEPDRYQWFETAFMVSALMRATTTRVPFAHPPAVESAKALWNGIAEYQVAWPFTALTVDDLDDFIARWAQWFASASQGQLHSPSQMPERSPAGSWRKS